LVTDHRSCREVDDDEFAVVRVREVAVDADERHRAPFE
jgi:hypothetical protein